MTACIDEVWVDEPEEDEAATAAVEARLMLRSNGRGGGNGMAPFDRWAERIGSGGDGAVAPASVGEAATSPGSSGAGGGSGALATWTGGGSGVGAGAG